MADPHSLRRLEQHRHFHLVFGAVELSTNFTIIISMIRVAGAVVGVVDVIVIVTVIVTVMNIISINIGIIITTIINNNITINSDITIIVTFIICVPMHSPVAQFRLVYLPRRRTALSTGVPTSRSYHAIASRLRRSATPVAWTPSRATRCPRGSAQ